jgi:predicted Zn-dependent protease
MATLPPVPFKVKALAPYTPTTATEIALVVGQIYEVTNTDGKGVWVQSQVNGVVGWFPFNYTEVVSNAAPAAAPAAKVSSPRATATPSAPTKASSSTTALKKKPKKEKRNRPKNPGPALRSHVEKNKKNHPVTVNVQRTIIFTKVSSSQHTE